MNRWSFVVPAIAVLTAALVTVEATATERLTAELLVDLRQVRDIALSPDGHLVAYTLEVPRAEEEEPGPSWSELWLTPVEGGEPRRFAGTRERISHPAWSPDGTLVTFLTDREREEGKGLFAIPPDGGEARKVFEHDGSISTYRWSPDGGAIAFVAKAADSEEEEADQQAGRDWVVADEDARYARLWRYDVEVRESALWIEDDLDVSGLVWTPDGRSLIVQAAATPRIDDEYMFSSIYVVGLDGKPRKLTETVGKLGTMAVAPDGKHLAFLGATGLNDPLAQSLFLVPLANLGDAKPRNLTQGLEASASDLQWIDDASLLLVTAEGAQHTLHRVGLEGARRSVPWNGPLVRDLDHAAKTWVIAGDSSSHPTELYTLEKLGARPQRRTRHNPELDEVRLARQEVVHWKGAGDWKISGVVTYPLDYQEGQRYPLVLQVHGGPEGVSLDGWTSSAGYPVQLLAGRGNFVLQPNYRGSQGRGVAFSKADHDDLGGREFEDVLAGVDALVAAGLVDSQRVGTGGWSYGGYMSAWAATRYSERFRASVMAAGLSNWIAFAGTTDIPYEMSLVHWNSWWFDEPDLHWERSPVAHINKAQTPTLIVHGAKDDRVHPEQGMELYNALRIKGVPTQLVVYPREPHGLRERAHRLDFIERTLDWFDQHLAPIETEQSAVR